ncbi:MAG TPA: BatA and WFA domain-containing protein [Candidatus Eisenbacteria bacterium]|nr:BatA and WFA domain-containing protein [Candidatus Eisenbacteria bacterium]
MPTFSFLNPSFLWALPVAAIPVLLHLLSRRRLPEVPFPTTAFLRALEPREIRRIRLREILLLILRTLALLFLVFAFARPALTPANAVTNAAAAVGILLDDSESMGAVDEEGRPRIEEAKRRAVSLIEASRAGDAIYLAPATREETPRADRGDDRVRLRRAVDRIEALPRPARMEVALAEVRRALERSPLPVRELYIISDFQRANLTPGARAEIARALGAAAAGIRVFLVPVADPKAPLANHAFEAIDPEIRAGAEGRGLELRARLANHAAAPSDRIAIRLREGDALVGGGDASLRAGERRWVAMPVEERAMSASRAASGAAAAAPTETRLTAEMDTDALAADDTWHAVLGAPRRLNVLRIVESRGGPPPRFASLALDPSGTGASGFSVEEGTPATLLALSQARADVVLLEDVAALSGDAEARLRAFVRDGGGVVVALGPHSDADYYGRRLFPGLIDLSLQGPERAPAGGAFELRARAAGHPILEGLTVEVGTPLSQARLSGLVRGATTTPRAEVVVQTSGGAPVVVAAPSVAVFLSSLADDWGELPFSGAYVPLVRGLVSHAARAESGAPLELVVGAAPRIRLSTTPSGGIRVRGPGEYVSTATVEAEGTGYRVAALDPAPAPGFYEFETEGRKLGTVAVNLDPVESDLALLPPDSIRAAVPPGALERLSLMPDGAALTRHLQATRRGEELWLPLLLLAAALLAIEIALASARKLRA